MVVQGFHMMFSKRRQTVRVIICTFDRCLQWCERKPTFGYPAVWVSVYSWKLSRSLQYSACWSNTAELSLRRLSWIKSFIGLCLWGSLVHGKPFSATTCHFLPYSPELARDPVFLSCLYPFPDGTIHVFVFESFFQVLFSVLIQNPPLFTEI